MTFWPIGIYRIVPKNEFLRVPSITLCLKSEVLLPKRIKRICFRHTFYTFNENLMLKTIFSIKKVCFPSEKYVFYKEKYSTCVKCKILVKK